MYATSSPSQAASTSTSTAHHHTPPPHTIASKHGNRKEVDDDDDYNNDGHDSVDDNFTQFRDARSDINDTGYSSSDDGEDYSDYDDDNDNDDVWHNASDLADLLEQANKCKAEGNTHFTAGRIQPAIEAYKQGIATLPPRKAPTPPSNHLRKGKGREDLAEQLLDDDDDDDDGEDDTAAGEDSHKRRSKSTSKVKVNKANGTTSDKTKDKIRELQGDEDEQDFVAQNNLSDEEKQVIELRGALWCNLSTSYFKQAMYNEAVESATQALKDKPNYMKALQRRASANEKLDTWTSLSSALEDNKQLLILPDTPKSSLPAIRQTLRTLPPKIEQRKQEETEKMMGQLKGLGNSLLGRFGLSTDNFQFTKTDGGGYSMNFVQNPSKA